MINLSGTIKLKNGHTLEIHRDESSESPREWDNICTMYCWHGRYTLGDISNSETTLQDFDDDAIIVPIYAYTKRGIRLATTKFNCPWDSGQLGFAAITKEEVIHSYGDDSLASRARARKCIEGEIETYNSYLDGDVFGYILKDSEGEEIDSCWGFYGYDPTTNGIFDQLDIGESEVA